MGSVLCPTLINAGYEVTVVDNLRSGQPTLLSLCSDPNFEFVRGDVRDESLMKRLVNKADVVIPLAAVVGAPACDRDPQLARSVNLEAIQLLGQLRSSQQLVVYPTTNSGYGTKSTEIFCTEETPLEPISLYGETKVQAEKFLLERPNTITLRLATVFGTSPRMRIDLLVNHLVYLAFMQGYAIIYEKGFKRNYIHIRDVADCFLYCLRNTSRMVGRPYNAGLEEANLSKEELALKIKEHLPNFYIHFAEVGCDPDRRNYVVSNQRLKDAGFVARRSIDEGIVELIKGYKMFGPTSFQNA